MPVDTLSCNLVDYIRMCMLLKCNICLTCNICLITIFLLAATKKELESETEDWKN